MGDARMRIVSVVGARPNFMKLAPLARELTTRSGVEHIVVHTGQHYDRNMSDTFFDDLGIPDPDINLGVGSASHAQQTARIMAAFEAVCLERKPDLVLVYGDVNSTVAAALVAAKLGIKVGHVEAGLRSRDWTMPEEINRVVTDRIADLLFTPSPDADDNLIAEGVEADRIHFVGNIMIDSLEFALPGARALGMAAKLGLESGRYVVVTLHRPSNVDSEMTLKELVGALHEIAHETDVVFPVHPRTRQRLDDSNLAFDGARLHLMDPLRYVEMLSLVTEAGVVLTDSGGLQEETSYLSIPCVTARPSTERPVTVTQGTNTLVASRKGPIVESVNRSLGARQSISVSIDKWDGGTAARIVDVLEQEKRG